MAAQKENKNIFAKLLKLLYILVIVFVCLISLFLIYYIVDSQLHSNDENYKPGLSIYTIVSPSMTPVIQVYDVVVNVKTSSPKDIQIGDIITYKSVAATSEGMTITHRVVNIDQLPDGTYEFMTQGDNNSEPDSTYVTYDQVIGKEILIIPYLGKLQFLIATQKGWLFLLLIPIGIYLIRELFKLVDLFGLRKKVNRIVGTTEESSITRRIEETNERKEKIRNELKVKESIKDSRVKNQKEPVSFLEEYNETTVSVANNRYIKPAATIKPVEPVEQLEIPKKKEVPKVEVLELEPVVEKETKTKTTTTKVKVEKEKKEEKVVLPKPKSIEIEDEYEILDTDDLTSKIKEYDNKIEKLDKMIKDMESISKENKTYKQEEKPFVEADNYLKGSRIKVSKVEETKNQKRQVTPRKNKTDKKTVDNSNIKIELKPVVTNIKNDRLKIERPVSEDISTIRAKEIQKERVKTEKVQIEQKPIRVSVEPVPVKVEKKVTIKEQPVQPIQKTQLNIQYPIIEDNKDEINIKIQPEKVQIKEIQPVVEEIKVEKKQATRKNKKLNLNPNKVKVINRGLKKKKLNLNPKNVTKVNRDTRKKKQKRPVSPLPKEPFISIKKIK